MIASGMNKLVQFVPCQAIAPQQLCLAHDAKHVQTVLHVLDGKTHDDNDDDTMTAPNFRDSLFWNEHSKQAVLMSAGAVCTLTGMVCNGELDNGFALVRPPGHHAGIYILCVLYIYITRWWLFTRILLF